MRKHWCIFTLLFFITSHLTAEVTQDTIPPIFTKAPEDFTISCEEPISIALQTWLTNGGGGIADFAEANVVATSNFNDALNELLQSFGTNCSDTGEVEVGFFAIDSCNNVSIDTLLAKFIVQDLVPPSFIESPSSIIVDCSQNTKDSLINWINTQAGSMTGDNCSDSVIWTHYTWIDSDGANGFVNAEDSTDIVIQRLRCDWSVNVTFFIQDECGNVNAENASFEILPDTIAPQFESFPADTTINCSAIIDTIFPIVFDACDGFITPTFIEQSTQGLDTLSCDFYQYNIQRIFSASDACGNSILDTQNIQVIDTLIPEITFENLVVISCEDDINDPNLFIQINDNCSTVSITFEDEFSEENQCIDIIDRTWAVEDVCSNTHIITQKIQVQDFEIPQFDRAPNDIIFECDNPNIVAQYNTWLNANANAIGTDNCSSFRIVSKQPGDYIDTLEILNAPSPEFIDFNCNSNSDNQILLEQEIEVFIFDDCGNFNSELVKYSVVDTVAPIITNCPTDEIIFASENDCSIDQILTLPEVDDNCPFFNPDWTLELDGRFKINFDAANPSINLDIGNHQIKYTVSDCGANTAQCIQNITIRDTFPPVISCMDSIFLFLENDACEILYDIPEIENFSDNCFGSLDFAATLPRDNGFIKFDYNSTDSTYRADDFRITFENITSEGRIFRPIIKVEYQMNLDSGSIVQVVSEFGDILLEISFSDCNEYQDFIILDENQFNVWASDEDIKFTIVFNDNNEMGVQPCDLSNVSPSDLIDDFSYFRVTLEYSDIIPSTEIFDAASQEISIIQNTVNLEVGSYTLEYSTSDRDGNLSSCQSHIEVVDNIAPLQECLDTIILYDIESGSIRDIQLEEVSSLIQDNCGIASTSLSIEQVNCTDIGSLFTIDVTSIDINGNNSVCQSTIDIQKDSLNPFFVSGLCLADTLKLFSGITNSSGLNFEWTGPNNFSSNLMDPILTGINDNNSGTYIIKATNADGCEFGGQLDIEVSLFDSPEIFSNTNSICQGDEIVLNSTSFTEIVDYFWYEGISPNGTLIGQTAGPSIIINPTLGEHFYYVEVEGENCNSNPSNTLTIEVSIIPQAIIANPFITVCEGDDIILESGNVEPNLNYFWEGPDGYSSTGFAPSAITNANSLNEGTYTLVVEEGSCFSDTAAAQVVIFENPELPIISADNVFCEGQTAVLSVNNIPNGTRYHWYFEDQLFNSVSTNNLVIPSISSSQSGSWSVIVEEGICSSDTSQSFEIFVESNFTIGASNNGPICEGDSIILTSTFLPGATYMWEDPIGNLFDGREIEVGGFDGTYTVTITTSSNCETSTSTQVEVGIRPEITALSNTALMCMDGQTDVSLIPTVFPPGNYQYLWEGPNGFSSNQERPTINNANTSDIGAYALTVRDGNCISSSVTTDVEFEIIPQAAFIVGNTTPCENSTIQIEISNPITQLNAIWIWNTPLGQVQTSVPFLEISDFSASNEGNYSVIQEVNGCRSDASNDIEVSLLNNPPLPIITGSVSFCEGEEIIIQTAEIPNTNYIWILPDGSTQEDDHILNIPNANISNEGNYSVFTQMGDCQSLNADLFFVEILERPSTPEFISNNINQCYDPSSEVIVCIEDIPQAESFILFEANSGTVILEQEAPCFDISFLFGPNGDNISLAAFSILNNCPSLASQEIQVDIFGIPNEIASLNTDTLVLCDQEFFNITPDVIPTDVSIDWRSPDPEINIIPSQNNNASFTNLRSGNNLIILDSYFESCGLYGSDTLNVLVLLELSAVDDFISGAFDQTLEIEFLNNDDFTSDIFIESFESPQRGEVELINNTFIYTPESAFVGTQFIDYTICYEACPDICSTAEITIELGDDIECFAGNLFTPNNDGQNDFFIIPCLNSGDYPQNALSVYNQWGDIVYEAAPYENDWAGTFNNKTLPTGTYYYVLNLGNGSTPIQGFIVLEL